MNGLPSALAGRVLMNPLHSSCQIASSVISALLLTTSPGRYFPPPRVHRCNSYVASGQSGYKYFLKLPTAMFIANPSSIAPGSRTISGCTDTGNAR